MKKGKRKLDGSDEVLATQGRCPEGHIIPRRGAAGDCTPIYCGDAKLKNKTKNELRAAKKAEAASTALALRPGSAVVPAAEEVEAAIERVQKKMALVEAKRAHFKVPRGLSGADAEEWADKKLVELTVEAVAELEEQLKLGSPDERFRAAGRVLDATGRGKRDIAAGTGPVIMLVGAKVVNGAVETPWMQRTDKKTDGNT